MRKSALPFSWRWTSGDPYLQHHQFVIQTDQQALLHLSDQRLHTRIQHKAFVKLMGLNYVIQYKHGLTNAAADTLSRRVHPMPVFAVSAKVPAWLDTLVEGYSEDAATQKILEELSITGATDK